MATLKVTSGESVLLTKELAVSVLGEEVTRVLDTKDWNEVSFYFGCVDVPHEPDCACDICVEDRVEAQAK